MEFSYENGMQRAEKELEATVNSLWPKFLETSPESKHYIKNEQYLDLTAKTEALTRESKNDGEKAKLEVLKEIVFGTFWHATDSWPQFKETLSKEDQIFYATLILEQAKGASASKNAVIPGYRYGNAWIVEKYNDDTLKEFITLETLKESVNRGFWEYANVHFLARNEGTIFSNEVALKRYEALMKHSEHLDLTRVDEFLKEPLGRGASWVHDPYIEAFDRARPKLSKETVSKLAVPIIEDIFGSALGWGDKFKKYPEKFLNKKIQKYTDLMDSATVQKMLIKEAVEAVKLIGARDEDDSAIFLRDLKVYLKHINLTDVEKAKIVSDNLDTSDGYSSEILIKIKFPKLLLTKEKAEELEKNTLEYLKYLSVEIKERSNWEEKTRQSNGKGIDQIDFARKAMDAGLLSKAKGNDFITKEVEAYISAAKAPSKSIALTWKQTVLPEQFDSGLKNKLLRRIENDVSASNVRSTKALMRVEKQKEKGRSLR